MNPAPLYKLLKAHAAPPHANEVMVGLMTCKGTRKMTLQAFQADPDMQALAELGLVIHEAGSLVVTKKAYELAGMNPPKTKIEVAP